MNEKENMEKMNPDLQDIEQSGFDPETDVTSTEGSDVAANEKIYVPYEEEAPYEASPENVMNLGHIGSFDELDESMAGEEEEEEDDDDKKPFISARMIKIGALMMLTTVVFILGIIAWFSMSKEVGGNGMGVTVGSDMFNLKTTGSSGLYDSFIDEVAPDRYANTTTTEGAQGIKWRLVKNTSEMNNLYDGEGEPDLPEITKLESDDYGLIPGDRGTLKFSVAPKSNNGVTVKALVNVTGYEATFESRDDFNYKTNDSLREVSNPEILGYISSHILFFYKDSNDELHLITDDGFIIDAPAETEVTIYWVWVATLREIINSNIDGLNSSVASTEVKRNFFINPENFLKPTGEEDFDDISVAEVDDLDSLDAAIAAKLPLVSGRNYDYYAAMYNDADQAIGDKTNYILVELTAVSDSGD